MKRATFLIAVAAMFAMPAAARQCVPTHTEAPFDVTSTVGVCDANLTLMADQLEMFAYSPTDLCQVILVETPLTTLILGQSEALPVLGDLAPARYSKGWHDRQWRWRPPC